ncbi:MAG: porin [Thalassotalea sp.]
MLKKTLIASALVGLFATNNAFANEETDELRAIIAKQQEVLKQLEKRLNETEKRIEAAESQAEVAATQIEATATQVEAVSSEAFSSTTLGGYGELHYNNNDNGKDIDFHRFVLFFGHEFTNKLRFFSEFELEHSIAGEGKVGEVELEQAYIEYDFSDKLSTKAGMFLIPVGIINETHEPPTFYGVERNPVEKNIIPATWWEAGAAFTYKPQGGLAFDMAITSGLKSPIDGSKAYNIRSGRQKVGKASAENLAYTGRVKYTGVPGLELAATLQYQQDITQGEAGVDKAGATLFEAHAVYQVDKFSLRALYATWNIDGAEAEALGRDEQTGWYVEPSYRFNEKIGAFVRYAAYDNSAGSQADTEKKQTSIGINYYLHDNVVLKADWEDNSGAADMQGFNLGVGYQF